MIDNDLIQKVWEKGRKIDGYDPDIIRKDSCGAWIIRSEYGNTLNIFGWEVDHVYPKSLGGDENILNLRPMQWENNKAKSNDYPTYNVSVQSENSTNIHVETQYTVNQELQDQLKELYHL